MEASVLKTLDWRINVITPEGFLDQFITLVSISDPLAKSYALEHIDLCHFGKRSRFA
jgi:hypothetical protein